MRIGIDCRSLLEPEPSGVSAYTRETVRALAQLPETASHQFVCFVNGFRLSHDAVLLSSLRKVADAPNVDWRVRGWPNKFLTSAEVFCSRPHFDWMFGKVDVVFLPNLQFFPRHDHSVPYVLTVHDLSFERYPECLDLKGRWRHRLLHPKMSARAAKRIIAVSEYTKFDVQSLYGISDDRIQVIYPGVAVGPVSAWPDRTASRGSLKRATLARKAGAPATRRVEQSTTTTYVAFVSTLEPRKNVETLLQAMEEVRKQHPQLDLVVIGRQGWNSAKLVKRLHALPYVHYLGYVDEATKRQVLAGAQAFIYPSLYEGFGFPPLEAQQHGVPVIAGAHSSLPEVVGESAVLVDVLDADAVARAIHHVLSDSALRERLIVAGHKNVQRFQWEESARRVLNVLTRVY